MRANMTVDSKSDKSGYKVSSIVKDENREYYRFLRRGELRVQRCTQCLYLRYPARYICPECLSEESEWQMLSGRGTVETFCWYLKNILDPRYTTEWSWQEAPYNVALVQLDEGPRLITNVNDVPFGELKVGQKVGAVFVPISDEYAIVRFSPKAGA